MKHIITNNEMEYGYIDDPVFSNYNKGHIFDGVYLKTPDGSEFSKERHSKGAYHMHNTSSDRVDGFTEIFREIGNINQIEISIDNNCIIINC